MKLPLSEHRRQLKFPLSRMIWVKGFYNKRNGLPSWRRYNWSIFGHAGHGKVRHPRSRLPRRPLSWRSFKNAESCSFKLHFRVWNRQVGPFGHKKNCKLIEKVSPERIRNELSKILISDRPKNFLVLRETGLLKYVLPEFDICFDTGQNHPYHVYNVGMHTLETVSNIESNLVLRWTMLLHDIGKPVVKTTDQNGTDHFYGHPEESVNIADKIMKGSGLTTKPQTKC